MQYLEHLTKRELGRSSYSPGTRPREDHAGHPARVHPLTMSVQKVTGKSIQLIVKEISKKGNAI